MSDLTDDEIANLPRDEWHAYWKGRCGHCGIKPPVYGYEGGDCPLHPVYVPLGPATGDKPVLTHGPCREIERWHALHHCAAFGKSRVDRYRNDANDGWEWGTYCCCGRCEVVAVEGVELPPEQLTLDLGNATVAGVWQPVHTVASL